MKLNTFESKILKKFNFPLIVIYEKPNDMPDSYVARLFDLDKPTEYFVQGATYSDIKATIPAFMTKILRDPLDDPKILESWV